MQVSTWGPEQGAAFQKLKDALSSAPVLHFPHFSRQFLDHTDASEQGVGVFLAHPSKGRTDDKEVDIVACCSKRFSPSQGHYSPTMQECLAVVYAPAHWRPYLWGRHFTCCTDHQALTYLYHMRDTSTLLTRWAICLQKYDVTVKHVPRKLHVVPDTLSCIFSEVDANPLPSEPQRAAICRDFPNDQPFQSPNPREYELSASNSDEIQPVESDRELFSSAVSVFPVVDAAKLLHNQKKEFRQYFDYLSTPTKARVPHHQSRSSMSKFFIHEGLLCRCYIPAHLRRRDTFRDQLGAPVSLPTLVINA